MIDIELEPCTENNEDVKLNITKAEYIGTWIVNIFIRFVDNLFPLIFLSLIASLVAFISSNFDHIIRIMLSYIENFGKVRYFTSILFLCLSTLIVQVMNPTVRGSGIPEMKLFLANWESPRMKDYLSFKAFCVKLIGLGFSILSGFPVGKEGPFVHISCAVVYFTKFTLFPQCFELVTCNYYKCVNLLNTFSFVKVAILHYQKWRLTYRRNVDVYKFLCSGCALGVACTFGAPIGGVMFSIEVTSQIFDITNYWHCFFTGLVGALFFRFFIGGIFHDNWFFKPFLQSNLQDEEYEFHHFYIYAGIGLACGILGSVFILIYYMFFQAGQIIYRILNYFFRRLSNKNENKYGIFHERTSSRRIMVSVVFTLLVATLLNIGDYIQSFDYQIPISQHEQLSLFFDNGERLMSVFKVIRPYSNNSHKLTHELDLNINFYNYLMPLSIFLFFKMLFFCPLIMCLPIPSGIFFPLMIAGACLGRLLGDLTKISSAGCAIVGAAGLSGAVTHSVSTAVIITEMSEEIKYLIPCAIAAFIGKFVAHLIAKYSIYEMIMRNRRMPYMPDSDEDIYPIFHKANAASFFTTGNIIPISSKPVMSNGKQMFTSRATTNSSDTTHNQEDIMAYSNRDRASCCSFLLYYLSPSSVSLSSNGETPDGVQANANSTNEDLRRILSLIYANKREMQWKLIPVVEFVPHDVSRMSISQIPLGYVRTEAAEVYLERNFQSIVGGWTKHPWWLKKHSDICLSSEEPQENLLEPSGCCSCQQNIYYSPDEWKQFLTQPIDWNQLLEEKPCCVTMTTKLPDILYFVQTNFLPQVFVIKSGNLVGIITRENIIDQIKKLHRQLGQLAVTYRADLMSLPMQLIKNKSQRHPSSEHVKYTILSNRSISSLD